MAQWWRQDCLKERLLVKEKSSMNPYTSLKLKTTLIKPLMMVSPKHTQNADIIENILTMLAKNKVLIQCLFPKIYQMNQE